MSFSILCILLGAKDTIINEMEAASALSDPSENHIALDFMNFMDTFN